MNEREEAHETRRTRTNILFATSHIHPVSFSYKVSARLPASDRLTTFQSLFNDKSNKARAEHGKNNNERHTTTSQRRSRLPCHFTRYLTRLWISETLFRSRFGNSSKNSIPKRCIAHSDPTAHTEMLGSTQRAHFSRIRIHKVMIQYTNSDPVCKQNETLAEKK